MSARASQVAPAAIIALIAHIGACASATPPAYRRSIEVAKWHPNGAYAWLDVNGSTYAGELIAAEPEAFVLEDNGHVLLLPVPCVRRVGLSWFEPDRGAIVAWGVLGTLSSLSHGAYFIITAPVWLLSTGIAAGAQGRAGLLDERMTGATEQRQRVRKWARFPQGLPAGYLPANLAGSPTGMACGQPYALPARWFR